MERLVDEYNTKQNIENFKLDREVLECSDIYNKMIKTCNLYHKYPIVPIDYTIVKDFEEKKQQCENSLLLHIKCVRNIKDKIDYKMVNFLKCSSQLDFAEQIFKNINNS